MRDRIKRALIGSSEDDMIANIENLIDQEIDNAKIHMRIMYTVITILVIIVVITLLWNIK